jgi:hypothetical protein
MRREARSDQDSDLLFQLPLGEFTSARNVLSSRLKKSGLIQKADEVKRLAKPSISAWAVNQVYMRHKEAFDDLTAAGRQLIEEQKSQLSGRAVDLLKAQERHRGAVSKASHLAEVLLRESGHDPTPDLVRRIHSTLMALSSLSSESSGV